MMNPWMNPSGFPMPETPFDYSSFPYQNPAWETVPNKSFEQEGFMNPGQFSQEGEQWDQNSNSNSNPNWQGGNRSPNQKNPAYGFWEYKPPGTEEEDDKGQKKEFKEGKIAQYQNDGPAKRPEKHDRNYHRRERDRDRNRRSRERKNTSRDRRDSNSPRNNDKQDTPADKRSHQERDSKHKDRRKEKDKREHSAEKDQFGRDVPRNRDKDSKKDRSPREKRKREDSSERSRDETRKRRDESSPRNRDRDRDRERDRERDDRGSRNYRSGEHGEGRYSLEAANYKTQTPNETIMIRGLAQHITENDIRTDILQCGMMPKDIRLIRKKETGASRGFAFVEFNTVEEAHYWMEIKQGVLMFQDQYRAVMQFSIVSNENMPTSLWIPTDWVCTKCFTHNFKKRLSCFKCHAPRREASDGLECGEEISPHPTTKLIIRNLDVLTNEEALLKEISNLSNIPIQTCQIGRDYLTNLSKGVCYLEMKNVLEAIKLYNTLTSTEFTVDGRKVSVSYCKLNLDKPHTPGTSTSSAQWPTGTSTDQAGLQHYKLEDVPRLAEYSAQMYATTPAEHSSYVQYYTQYYTSQISQGIAIQNPNTGTNAAAAVAHSAIQQAQSKKAVISASATPPVPTYMTSKQLIGNSTVGEPDVSSYTYDETSGYFFDQRTGLYYDATSQYYYHSQDQCFLYWDAEKRAYMPAPTEQTPNNTPAKTEEGKEDKKKDKEKSQDKVKVAKRIAKDMERWAKTLNQKKEVAKMNAVAVQAAQAAAKTASTADIAFAVLERKETAVVPAVLEQYSKPQEEVQANLVASYGGGSDSDEAPEDALAEDKHHTDWSKLACLLCKRQFPTREALLRHQQLSDLHKQNLESWYCSRGLDLNTAKNAVSSVYRDRAKERREKFGIPDEPKPNRLKEKYLKEREEMAATSYEEPNRAGIPSENLGNRMLQKMGWSEGMGLGRSNQGRTDIIEATQRISTAGLGVKGGSLGTASGSGTSYKENVKRSMLARYSELDD